jgi:class I fructose-bisphosphate aldolase
MTDIVSLLGPEADLLLEHRCEAIPRERITTPGSDYVDRILSATDRPAAVLRNYQTLLNTGRLRGTGYMSILPVDQGIEHSAGASFAPNPDYFDPQNIVELAIEGGCNAVASTLGALGSVSRRYAHKIPFIVKLNHNDALVYPTSYDQQLFCQVKQAHDMGALGIGATIYFGSDNSRRQLQEISEAFRHAHELGMVTILWCYLRNSDFKTEEGDFHTLPISLVRPITWA